MNSKTIEQRKNDVIAEHGRWLAHNIVLGDGVYTISNVITGDEIKLRRVIQIIADLAQKKFDRLRILDLACLEGLYAVELARQGATVVGIEGRESNIAKARFAKEVLSLHNLELLQDDVRRLSRQKHGEFDVVLCLGILYHLDTPDVFSFLTQVAHVCTGFAIIDTHISYTPETSREFAGNAYWGKLYREHSSGSTLDEIAADNLASLDNRASFWFTRPSLYNLLAAVGFTSVYECHIPPEPDKPINRLTVVAPKGSRAPLLSSPLMSAKPFERLPEL